MSSSLRIFSQQDTSRLRGQTNVVVETIDCGAFDYSDWVKNNTVYTCIHTCMAPHI